MDFDCKRVIFFNLRLKIKSINHLSTQTTLHCTFEDSQESQGSLKNISLGHRRQDRRRDSGATSWRDPRYLDFGLKYLRYIQEVPSFAGIFWPLERKRGALRFEPNLFVRLLEYFLTAKLSSSRELARKGFFVLNQQLRDPIFSNYHHPEEVTPSLRVTSSGPSTGPGVYPVIQRTHLVQHEAEHCGNESLVVVK